MKLGEPEVFPVTTPDGTELRLTRHHGGNRGPVVLAPGYGTSTLALALDTVEVNFPEVLYRAGYDVWLFDYRASPALPSSHTQFTVDDLANQDWPAGVARVREETGAESVQVVAHCVGSMSFLMSQLNGLQGVRSAICSQTALHPVASTYVKTKSALRLADVLDHLGVHGLSTDFRADVLADRVVEDVMKHFPTREHCDNPTCHRVLFIYGEVYKHAQLNEATHDTLHEMFGMTNATFFEHMTKVLNAGRVLDHHGQDTYLPQAANAAIPISFIHGRDNNFFMPVGTQLTLDFLREANGDGLYSRHEIPDYAHMDCFIGKNASRDVFPTLLAEVEKFN
jgi:cholesterol oxidase